MSDIRISINDVIEQARTIATGSSSVKEASATPAIKESEEGAALRTHAAALRSFDFSGEKTAAVSRVLEGDMPSKADLVPTSTKLASHVEPGDKPSSTLRNVATTLRQAGEQAKKAAHVEAFNEVRGHVAALTLKRHFGL